MKLKKLNTFHTKLPKKGAFTIETEFNFPKLHTLNCVSGRRGSGKGCHIANFCRICKEKGYFDRVYLITPTYNSNKSIWDICKIEDEDVFEPDMNCDAINKQLMDAKGYLELPFKRMQDFQTTTATDVRFNIASTSLDRLWIVHRDANYNTQGPPVRVAGYISDASGGNTVIEYNSIFDYNKERFISRHFNMPVPNTNMKMQVNINSMNYPQFQGDIKDWVYITKNSLENVDMNYGLRTFQNNYCVFCLRLNLVHSEKLRLISGLNTKGINASGTVNYFNSTNRPIVVFAECTSILKIAPGAISYVEL